MEEKRARLSNLLHRYRFEDLWPVTVTEVTDLLGDSTALGAEAAAEAAKLAQQEERGTYALRSHYPPYLLHRRAVTISLAWRPGSLTLACCGCLDLPVSPMYGVVLVVC